MTFELFCMALIALFVGVAVTFNGYRWFLILLPILGFVFGFGLGVDTMNVIFSNAPALSTITGWVVGFFVGLIFAVLSYLFYIVGVALVAGGLGYAIGVGLMGLIFDPGFITWLVGMVFAIGVAIAALALNIQKWIIIAATAFGGAGIIVGTFLSMFGVIKPENFGSGAVKLVIANNFLWLVFFLALAIAGFVGQYYSTRNFTLTPPENQF